MDLAFESWIITDINQQKQSLGQVYNSSELVPLNYQKIFIANFYGNLPEGAFPPVREFLNIQVAEDYGNINNEILNNIQGRALSETLGNLYEYWVDSLITNYQIPLGVVTEMKSSVSQDGGPSILGKFHVITTFKINWFVLPDNPFS
jgi:hypothetical protein